MTFTNVTADAVNTIEWLSAGNTTIAVPVYQRQYRWEIDACRQLLSDIRAVAKGDARHTHFIGSILHTATGNGQITEWTLIDGQQRVATLMLLLAALRYTLRESDKTIAARLQTVLQHPTGERRTRLRLLKEGVRELDSIVFEDPLPDTDASVSNIRDNYLFFRQEIQNDALAVWDGLQKLEHVAIALQEHANPQQVFESLNSTGTPLRNHELVHNYILMGLSFSQQSEIEGSFWIPIEENTGDAIDNFLRDYLIMKTWRDSEFSGEHGVYKVFKEEFPRPKFESLTRLAEEWKSYSEVYRILLDPARDADEDVSQQLRYTNTFGTAMYPLLLQVYRDYQLEKIDRSMLLEILEQLQSLYLRLMVVGASPDHLAAQLCRKVRQYGYPINAIARRTPTDERIREALIYRPLPHAGYVLQRIDQQGNLAELEIEHIFPQSPTDTWSGDGIRQWHAFTELKRAKYRELRSTIGNLALLEQPLNGAASNGAFHDKKDYYSRSRVPSTKALAEKHVWDLQTISGRTKELAERFLQIWKHPRVGDHENLEHLVRIFDAPKKPGWYSGWEKEFEYARFHGEVWEVRNLKTLYNRIFKRLWETNRTEVLAFSDSHIKLVHEEAKGRSQWDTLPPSHYLFMGLYPQYMLDAIQRVLDELDMADEVYVKYSNDED